MKKIFLAVLIVMTFCACSFAAVSDDIYVRKDLFEVHMKNIDSKLDNILQELALQREDIKNLRQDMSRLEARVGKLESRVEGIYSELTGRMDNLESRMTESYNVLIARMTDNYRGLDSRISDLRNGLYLGLVFFGTVVLLSFFRSWYDERQAAKEAKRNSFTLEDVEKLVTSIIDARLSSNLKA